MARLSSRDGKRVLVDTLVIAFGLLVAAQMLLASGGIDGVEDCASLGSDLVEIVGTNLAVSWDSRPEIATGRIVTKYRARSC